MTYLRNFTTLVALIALFAFAMPLVSADAQFRQPGEGGGTAGTVPPIYDAPHSVDNPAEPKNDEATPQTRVNNIRGGTHAARRMIDNAFSFRGTIEKDAIFVPDSKYGYKITKQKFADMDAARKAEREAEAAKEKIKAAMVVASSGSAKTKEERALAFDIMSAAADMSQEIKAPAAGTNLEAWVAYKDHVQEMYLLAANTVGSMKANQEILPLLIADGLVAAPTSTTINRGNGSSSDNADGSNSSGSTTTIHNGSSDREIDWRLIVAAIVLLPLVLFYGYKAYKTLFIETKSGVKGLKGFWGRRRDKKTEQLAEAIAQANNKLSENAEDKDEEEEKEEKSEKEKVELK